LAPVIERCLEKRPELRYTSFEELREDSETLLLGLTGELGSTEARLDEESALESCLIELAEPMNLGHTLVTLGRPGEAIPYFDQALAADVSSMREGLHKYRSPDLPLISDDHVEEILRGLHYCALARKGVCLAHLQRFEEAHACLEMLPEPDDAGEEALRLLLEFMILQGLGNHLEAVTCIDRAVERGVDPSLLLDGFVATSLFELGRYDEALTHINKALEREDRSPGWWLIKAQILSRSGDMDQTFLCVARALALDPLWDEAWGQKGHALLESCRYQEAFEAYSRASELDPSDSVWHENMGVSLLKMGRHAEALQCAGRALELRPENARAWAFSGLLYNRLGDYREAIACCDKALEVDATYPEAWADKGLALDELGRPHEALECYDKALEIRPDYAMPMGNKANVLTALGRLAEAEVCCDKAMKLDPASPICWYNKALITAQRSPTVPAYKEAIGFYSRALELDPGLAPAWFNKAKLETDTGLHLDARRSLEAFLRVAPPQDKEQRKAAERYLKKHR
jgi:tetratricopeptide (TPR) repeat protein